ncbi:MAG: hypothetical protein M0Z28_30470 [Rhodospirillales bacterium]|nr:hypothetical protein [Rhodospirillales bacterium]
MAKERKRGNREVKKPKAAKKPVAVPSSLTAVAQLKRPPPKGRPNDQQR